jgi:hypothetical protein
MNGGEVLKELEEETDGPPPQRLRKRASLSLPNLFAAARPPPSTPVRPLTTLKTSNAETLRMRFVGTQEREEGQVAAAGSETSPASGLKWREVGNNKPRKGEELTNESLVARLVEQQMEFTQAEWDAFGITGLHIHHCIKSGTSYFQPAAPSPSKVEFTLKEWDKDGISRLALSTDHYIKSGATWFRAVEEEPRKWASGLAWEVFPMNQAPDEGELLENKDGIKELGELLLEK